MVRRYRTISSTTVTAVVLLQYYCYSSSPVTALLLHVRQEGNHKGHP